MNLVQRIKRYFQVSKLNDRDRAILRAGNDLVNAYARWRCLVAARDAEVQAEKDISEELVATYKSKGLEHLLM